MSGMLENGFGGHNGESLKQSPKSDMSSTESDASMLHKTSKKHLKASLSKAFLSKGMPVTFKDVVYTVVNSQNKKEKINLLKGVSGYFEVGQMAALMGPSGSGKSTLLDVLAGRKTVGKISGDIKFGGEKPSRNFLRRYTGYVEQTDTLLPILTVEEMLLYTADLKKPISESKKSKMDAVEELLGVLALDSCRDVLIGSELARGISGGQAKRVNIGISFDHKSEGVVLG
ncbi:ABC transporter G family member 22 [Picochlorum sp. SENEW3]|nr:ABC transporter G family member 22 [Picochlorum sp. SENEW3]WPT13875.1 ABC transporter G family member 22 [Picochlorum sp. SENEW3]